MRMEFERDLESPSVRTSTISTRCRDPQPGRLVAIVYVMETGLKDSEAGVALSASDLVENKLESRL